MLVIKTTLLFIALLSLFIGIVDLVTKSVEVSVNKKSKKIGMIDWIFSALFFAAFYYFCNYV